MKTALFCIALMFSIPASADTLVIIHPSFTETMNGDFLQLNMSETTGGLEFVVAERTAQKKPAQVSGSDTIWHIGLWIDGGYNYSQSECAGEFAYNYGAPVLTLACAQ
jgi:hypothetical protein